MYVCVFHRKLFIFKDYIKIVQTKIKHAKKQVKKYSKWHL